MFLHDLYFCIIKFIRLYEVNLGKEKSEETRVWKKLKVKTWCIMNEPE